MPHLLPIFLLGYNKKKEILTKYSRKQSRAAPRKTGADNQITAKRKEESRKWRLKESLPGEAWVEKQEVREFTDGWKGGKERKA